jgi:4-amino-4-deoxy-L-arabinose transferase-like glycosyltransferase
METMRRSGVDLLPTPDEVSSRGINYVPLGSIVLVFAAVTLWLSSKLNLYIDELYSLHTTSHGFGYALDQSLGFEQQPPLFFLVLTAWRTLDASDSFARLFSIGCCLATLYVVWHFGRRYFGTLPNWLTPLTFAINPFFLWVALDIRVYAMIVLLSALLVTLFFDAFGGERVSLGHAIAFTTVAIAGIYTQYFIGSMLLGFALALLLCGRWRRIVPFGVSMIVVALAFLPLLLGSVGNELSQETSTHVVAPLVLAGRMLSSTLSFVYPHTWIEKSKALNVLYIALVVATLVFVLRERRRRDTVAMLAVIVASMIAFFLVVIIVVAAPLEMPRHISALYAPAMLFTLAAFAAIENAKSRKRVAFAYLGILLLFGAADDVKTYHPPISNSGDWQRVGAFLNARVAPSEPIAVFDTEGALGVRHYYRGRAPVVPLPHEQSFTVFDRRDFAITSPHELATLFPRASVTTGRAWLVYGVTACSMIEIGASCSYLDAYIASHFHVVSSAEFNGTTVEELQAI